MLANSGGGQKGGGKSGSECPSAFAETFKKLADMATVKSFLNIVVAIFVTGFAAHQFATRVSAQASKSISTLGGP